MIPITLGKMQVQTVKRSLEVEFKAFNAKVNTIYISEYCYLC